MARLMIKLSSKSASSGIFCFRKIYVKRKNIKTRNQRKSKRTSLWKKSTYMWKTTVHHRNGPVSLLLYLGRFLESAWLVVLINIGTTVVATETALIVRHTMDIDMDDGIMVTIMYMGVNLAVIKAAAVWINGEWPCSERKSNKRNPYMMSHRR